MQKIKDAEAAIRKIASDTSTEYDDTANILAKLLDCGVAEYTRNSKGIAVFRFTRNGRQAAARYLYLLEDAKRLGND